MEIPLPGRGKVGKNQSVHSKNTFFTMEGSLVNKIDLQALYLSGTYCHKTGTRPPKCTSRRQTIYIGWLVEWMAIVIVYLKAYTRKFLRISWNFQLTFLVMRRKAVFSVNPSLSQIGFPHDWAHFLWASCQYITHCVIKHFCSSFTNVPENMSLLKQSSWLKLVLFIPHCL